MEIIGQGEVAALEIIKDMFGNSCEYLTQVKLSDMVTPEYLETFSDRQLKETIDIVVVTVFECLAIRVQVIDIWHYECKELWKDKVNEKSRLELENAIKESSID